MIKGFPELRRLNPKRSLYPRLIIWFLLISLLPLAWITFISYESSKKMLINQAVKNLHALNTRQAQAVENYIADKINSTKALAKNSDATEAISQLEATLTKYGKNSSQYKEMKGKYKPTLTYLTEILGYSNLFLATNNGEILFSTFPSSILEQNLNSESFQGKNIQEIFLSAKNLLETQISASSYYDIKSPPTSFIATPMTENNILVGVMLVQIDNANIYNLITDYSGLGATGETILVTRIGNSLVSQSPLRENLNPSFIQFFPSQTPFGEFVNEVLNGDRHVKEILDYKDKETLAVGHNLQPILNWGVITKIDMDELLAPIKKLRILFIFMTLTTAGIVILTAFRVVRTITGPIVLLTNKTRLMATGDLSQRIYIKGNDEIADLASSINDLAARLNNIIQHLDAIVAKRTDQVKRQNTQLENTINELKETQDRLINQEKLASLGALTAGIAHEIKNPLNFVNNFAELSLNIAREVEKEVNDIKGKIEPQEASILQEHLSLLKTNIDKIHDHGKRADNIVKGMLEHSKESTGELTLTNINALIDEYITLSYHGIRAQEPNFNVKIDKFLDPKIPKILVSPQDMSRVFLNILNNAYYSVYQKQKSDENYQPLVRVSTFLHNHYVVIKIWDNGMGIEPSILSKLFTPFFTTKPTGEGTGLGLSLSYNIIVHGHGGTITAASKVGEFAEFTIVLPVKP